MLTIAKLQMLKWKTSFQQLTSISLTENCKDIKVLYFPLDFLKEDKMSYLRV